MKFKGIGTAPTDPDNDSLSKQPLSMHLEQCRLLKEKSAAVILINQAGNCNRIQEPSLLS